MKSEEKELIEYAAAIRSLIQHENEVSNHRLTWMLLLQGILFAASAAFWEIALFPLLAIALLGISSSISFAYSLWLSYRARVYLRSLWKLRIGDNKELAQKIPPVAGDPIGIKTPILFRLPHLNPWLFIPWAIVLCWLAMIIYRVATI